MIREQTYRLYPNKTQCKKLDELLEVHRILYNSALEQRIEEWNSYRRSVSYYDQSKELTKLRNTCQEYKNINVSSLEYTLLRLNKAFNDFYRRIKNKETSGFPRFKSRDRFHSINFEHNTGIWIQSTQRTKVPNMKVVLSSIGNIRYRGNKQYQNLTPKFCTILKKNSKWYLTCAYQIDRNQRLSGSDAIGIDWGVKTLATTVTNTNEVHQYENPKLLQKQLPLIKKLQRSISRKKKNSNNQKREKRKLSNKHTKIAKQRKAFLHKITSNIVSRAALLAVEKLDIKSMTRSDIYGAKTSLNRSILDTSPYELHQMLKYKAEEAGIWYIEVDTKKHKPTQTCSECFNVEKKCLDQRIHSCKKCGYTIDRDINASQTILKVALKQNSWKPAVCGNSSSCTINETLSTT